MKPEQRTSAEPEPSTGSKPRKPKRPESPALLGEEHLRAIYDAVYDAIIIQDLETGSTLDVNQRMCEMFGYPKEEALQQNLGTLGLGIPPYTKEDAAGWVGKAAEGEPQTIEWLAKDKAKRMLWIEANIRTVDIGSRNLLLITARNITERKRTEVDQSQRLKRAEAQNAVSMALAGVGLSYEAALELIARYLAAQVGDLCLLDLMDGEGRLQPAAMDQAYIDGAPFLPELRALAPLDQDTPGAGEVARTGQSIRLTHVEVAEILPLLRPEFKQYLEKFAIHSLLVVPMRHQGRVIGTFTLAKGGSSRPYSMEDQAMLQNLADRAALTITNAKLYEENLRQAEELRVANVELEKRVAERTAELAEANDRLQQLASQDGLTGLANRRTFDSVMDMEIRRARREGSHLSLLLTDVDFFKKYNDLYGHPGGDACLQAVGQVMRDVFRRAGEMPARYGGEEFAVILPGVTSDHAMKVAEKLLKAIETRHLPHEKSDVADHVTLSIGVVTAQVSAEMDAEWFVTRADEALYRSKARGRNCATAAE